MQLNSEKEVKEAVERAISKEYGRQLTPRAWKYLRRSTLAIADAMLYDDCTELVADWAEFEDTPDKPITEEVLEKGSQTRIHTRTEPLNRRAYLVSRLVACQAAEDLVVRSFRSKYLPNALLDETEVQDWIQKTAREDGPPTKWKPESVPSGWEIKVLSYAVPEDDWAQSVPVAAGGVLDTLRLLSERLSRIYHWQKSQAADFVLTGQIPLVSPARITAPMLPSPLARIKLDVDATTSPAKVEELYSEARQEVLAGERYRPLSEKVARLVNFVLNHPGKTWNERMTIWNKQHPEGAYSHPEGVSMVYHRAVRKLIGEPDWDTVL